MKKLSLVIPCYNESESIPELLKSCNEAFDGKDVEVVIVDNGSTDNTQEVISKLLDKYKFVTLVSVQKNIGYGHGIVQGLKQASGEILGWTHADLQTNPVDAIKGLNFFNNKTNTFVKGKRYGRPILDTLFTIGMSFFETLLMKTLMWDINAQPTLFHRSFFDSWKNPPDDFSLDLFVYFMAKKEDLNIKRFPVLFSDRKYGESHWNINFSGKYKFIKRTLQYSFLLKQRFKGSA
jgi:glycosyltransferase involved in cell wall biosynthesis